jgi:hypothetical protein
MQFNSFLSQRSCYFAYEKIQELYDKGGPNRASFEKLPLNRIANRPIETDSQ